MQNLQMIREYGPLAILAIVALYFVRGFLSDLGRSLWQATAGRPRGWLALILALASFTCAAYSVVLVKTSPVDVRGAVQLLAASLGLLALTGALALHAVVQWLDMIAHIQRGEFGKDARRIRLF